MNYMHDTIVIVFDIVVLRYLQPVVGVDTKISKLFCCVLSLRAQCSNRCRVN
jgi:hypothetical protein